MLTEPHANSSKSSADELWIQRFLSFKIENLLFDSLLSNLFSIQLNLQSAGIVHVSLFTRVRRNVLGCAKITERIGLNFFCVLEVKLQLAVVFKLDKFILTTINNLHKIDPYKRRSSVLANRPFELHSNESDDRK